MKALYIIYNAAIESRITACMEDCSLNSYTKFPAIHGAGSSAGPRLNTHVWPGVNNALLVIAEDDRIPEMLDKIRDLKDKYSREGVKAFVFPVEEVV